MMLPSGASAKLNSETGEEREEERAKEKDARAREGVKGGRSGQKKYEEKRVKAKKKGEERKKRLRIVSREDRENKCLCVHCVYDCVLLETSCQPIL